MNVLQSETIKEIRKKILLCPNGNFAYNILPLTIKICETDSKIFSTTSEIRFMEIKSLITGAIDFSSWTRANNFYTAGTLYSI